MATRIDYDTSIGTEERSVRSATKFWGIVFAIILMIGLVMIGAFFLADRGDDPRYGAPTVQQGGEPGP